MNTNRKRAISDAFSDPERGDYGIRVGWGEKFNLRAGARLAEKFPDGCRVTVDTTGPLVKITLRNRVTGQPWRADPSRVNKDERWLTVPNGHLELVGPRPRFGAVSPSSVQPASGGAVEIILTADLPSVKPSGPRKKTAAGEPAPEVYVLPTPTGQPSGRSSTLPAVIPESEVTAPAPPNPPEISLSQAVEALNAWKRYMGDRLAINVTVGGRVSAMAEYV